MALWGKRGTRGFLGGGSRQKNRNQNRTGRTTRTWGENENGPTNGDKKTRNLKAIVEKKDPLAGRIVFMKSGGKNSLQVEMSRIRGTEQRDEDKKTV